MLVVLGVLLGACGDDREVTPLAAVSVECETSQPALGASCGGGDVFENNYQNQGTVLIADVGDESAADYKSGNSDTANAEDADDGRNNTGTFNVNHPASLACQDLVSGGFDDWSLPAENELLALYNNQSSVTGISAVDYWSSTESGTVTRARALDMSTGTFSNTFKSTTFNVRCIRRFTFTPTPPAPSPYSN